MDNTLFRIDLTFEINDILNIETRVLFTALLNALWKNIYK